jgi:hypothetical protein
LHPAFPPSGKYDHENLYNRAIILDNAETRAALVGADLPNITNVIWSGAALVIAKELNCHKTQRTGRLRCLVAGASPRQI